MCPPYPHPNGTKCDSALAGPPLSFEETLTLQLLLQLFVVHQLYTLARVSPALLLYSPSGFLSQNRARALKLGKTVSLKGPEIAAQSILNRGFPAKHRSMLSSPRQENI